MSVALIHNSFIESFGLVEAWLPGTLKKTYIELAALWSGNNEYDLLVRHQVLIYIIQLSWWEKWDITKEWSNFFQGCHTKLLKNQVSKLLEWAFVFLNHKVIIVFKKLCSSSVEKLSIEDQQKQHQKKPDNYSA